MPLPGLGVLVLGVPLPDPRVPIADPKGADPGVLVLGVPLPDPGVPIADPGVQLPDAGCRWQG